MASVQSSRAAKCARRGLPEDEAPDHLPSAGELFIKELARKQANTNITLEDQLKEEKKFERGVGCVLIGEFTPGTSSLQEFQESQQRAEKIQEFEGRGLTRQEAEAELSGLVVSKASPAALAANQLYIQRQLATKPSCRIEGAVSRRDLELAASMKPDSVETRLYKFAMENKASSHDSEKEPADHPVHRLVEMERSLTEMSAADPQKMAKTVRRKRRQLVEALAEPSTVHFKPPDKTGSLWDCIEPPVVLPRQPPGPSKVATCKRETFYTIRDSRIVPVDTAGMANNGSVEKCKESNKTGQPFVMLKLPQQEANVSGRLSELEIKTLPRFENYERGEVSKVLYIKNLSSSVSEGDLVAVFAKFQEENEEKIIFRLMNGKMRGQAFVTFRSCALATKALDEVNGTILQGKPMVIQYGRHKT